MRKLIVEIRLLRREGWRLPRFRACMYPPMRGVLALREVSVPELMRLSRVAELRDSATNLPRPDFPPLYDATLIAADGGSWTLTGFERIRSSSRLIDYAQTWLVDPIELLGE